MIVKDPNCRQPPAIDEHAGPECWPDYLRGMSSKHLMAPVFPMTGRRRPTRDVVTSPELCPIACLSGVVRLGLLEHAVMISVGLGAGQYRVPN